MSILLRYPAFTPHVPMLLMHIKGASYHVLISLQICSQTFWVFTSNVLAVLVIF